MLSENREGRSELSAESGEECEGRRGAGEGSQGLVGLVRHFCFSLF